ncbi:MAG: hypothetical protein AAF243_02860 [Cyanobacteria bacterium P01_A01_bin.137]
MPTLFDTHLIDLHSQPSIQGHDLLTICALAESEGMVESIESYSFDQFLGLTIHLFVTTQSQDTREQLAQQLTKFGSAAVLPLIKILWRMRSHSSLQLLAQNSLEQMAPYSLIIGLSHFLDRETNDDLREIATQMLVNLMQDPNRSVLLSLPKLVSSKTWRLLKLHLLAEKSYPTDKAGCFSNNLPVEMSIILSY